MVAPPGKIFRNILEAYHTNNSNVLHTIALLFFIKRNFTKPLSCDNKTERYLKIWLISAGWIALSLQQPEVYVA